MFSIEKLVFVLILVMGLVSAGGGDKDLVYVCGGDENLVIHCIGDEDLNSLGYGIPPTPQVSKNPTGGNFFFLNPFLIFSGFLFIFLASFIFVYKRKKKKNKEELIS